MDTLTIMIAVWGIVVAGFLAVTIYRTQIEQNETEQLYLAETEPSLTHKENDEIVRRVDRLQPIQRGMGGAAALATVLVIGVWAAQQLAKAHLL
jgi:hypothetical protein